MRWFCRFGVKKHKTAFSDVCVVPQKKFQIKFYDNVFINKCSSRAHDDRWKVRLTNELRSDSLPLGQVEGLARRGRFMSRGFGRDWLWLSQLGCFLCSDWSTWRWSESHQISSWWYCWFLGVMNVPTMVRAVSLFQSTRGWVGVLCPAVGGPVLTTHNRNRYKWLFDYRTTSCIEKGEFRGWPGLWRSERILCSTIMLRQLSVLYSWTFGVICNEWSWSVSGVS